jgi:hypothetical protein
MKNYKTYLYLFGILLFMVSCKGMNDNIEEYLERGEINYLGRPDFAYTLNGNGRVNIGWFVNDDPRIEGCTITWNGRNNEPQSASFPINHNALVNGYVNVPIELEEATYVFKIVHTGEKGYPSIATEVSGRVYGANYFSTLSPRKITSIEAFSDRIEINWLPADATVTKVLFTYETIDGQQTIEIAPEETKTVLTNHKTQGRYSWITYYLPEPNALDEFSVVSNNAEFPDI